MAEKITLKSMLANLPQKTDVDTVVGRDSSGNPVYIKKSDLAQVVAELIPTATAEKNGLLSKENYIIIPKTYRIGNPKNAINLGTYNKNWIRFSTLLWGYSAEPFMAMGYLFSCNTGNNTKTSPIVSCISFGKKSPEYKFLYRDNGNSYTFYFYVVDGLSSMHPIYTISENIFFTENITIDDSYKEISIVG